MVWEKKCGRTTSVSFVEPCHLLLLLSLYHLFFLNTHVLFVKRVVIINPVRLNRRRGFVKCCCHTRAWKECKGRDVPENCGGLLFNDPVVSFVSRTFFFLEKLSFSYRLPSGLCFKHENMSLACFCALMLLLILCFLGKLRRWQEEGAFDRQWSKSGQSKASRGFHFIPTSQKTLDLPTVDFRWNKSYIQQTKARGEREFCPAAVFHPMTLMFVGPLLH